MRRVPAIDGKLQHEHRNVAWVLQRHHIPLHSSNPATSIVIDGLWFRYLRIAQLPFSMSE
jgi:hypothetical protein